METVTDFIFGATKSLQLVTAAMKLKDIYSLGKKVMANLDSILKSRDVTLPTKVCLVNSSYEVAKVLEFQLWHPSFQRNPRADLL